MLSPCGLRTPRSSLLYVIAHVIKLRVSPSSFSMHCFALSLKPLHLPSYIQSAESQSSTLRPVPSTIDPVTKDNINNFFFRRPRHCNRIDANAAHAPRLDSTHMRIPQVAMCCQSNVAWATTAAHDGGVPQKQSPVSTFTFRLKEKVLTNDSRQQFCKVNELKSSDTAYIEPGYDIYNRIVHMQR